MKKIVMWSVLCSIAHLQALTVKNNSDTTVKVTINGHATGLLGFVLLQGESTPVIAPAAGQYVDYIKVDKFDVLDNAQGTCSAQLPMECIGCRETDQKKYGVTCRKGSVKSPGQLAIVRRKDSFFGIEKQDNFVFSGSKTTGYSLKK